MFAINAQAAIFTVDTTADVASSACTAAANDCSLRGAITASDGVAGLDTIAFNIPMTDAGCVPATGVCRITLGSVLTLINVSNVIIDGYTQPGAQPNTIAAEAGGLNSVLKIEIVRSVGGSHSAFNTNSAGNNFTLRGVAISGFGGVSAIGYVGGLGTVYQIEGNYLGTDASGNATPVRNGVAVGLSNSAHRIGGTLPAQRNLISNNDTGIVGLSDGLLIQGNLIGTNRVGTQATPNGEGIRGQGGSIVVGGSIAGARNVISGNTRGIVTGGSLSSAQVQGNFIGTDVSGLLPLGNGLVGVEMAPNNPSTVVGGLMPGEGNTIAFNGTQGVATRGTRGRVAGNQMFGNGQLGIGNPGDNGSAAGRRPNDPGDLDAPSNNGQNFPELSAAVVSGNAVNLSYRVDSATANSVYPLRVEFFKADGDEGRNLLGIDSYAAAQAQSVKSISLPIPGGVSLGSSDVIVATATDANGNTSQFSFHPAVLNIIDDGPDPSPSGTPYAVTVEVAALSGPFVPNGVVQVSDGAGGMCTATLAPAASALTAGGTCLLASGGAPRTLTLTASYNTFQHAFATEAGTSPSAATAHTLGPPPPEQVSFARCVEYVLETQGMASIRVNRQGSGNVSVAFEHVAGTATAGLDYTAPTAGVLSWVGSDQTPRFINVPILSDAVPEPVAETFRLRLFDPLGTSITPIGLLEARIHDAPPGRVFHDGFDGNGCP